MPDPRCRPAVVARLPHEPGVYRFRDATGRVLYLGRAVDLRRRVGSYWGDLGERRHLAPMVARIRRVEVLACASEHEAAWAERNLLAAALPRWNRTLGVESPLYLRLDTSARSPGIVSAYRARPGTRHFGPYLGGRKVRLAIAGLHRVHPLGSAGEALSASARELARTRGTGGAATTAELAAALTAVLDRDPAAVAAVRSELERRRDVAAGALAFELAGRLQEELAAVEWVVAPQQVTCPGGGDADPCGWSDGVLLQLDVRAGLLCGWRQRATREPGSGTRGPAGWAVFVRRNAELAAALAA